MEERKSLFAQLQERKLKPVRALNNSRLSMYKKCNWLYKLYQMGVRSKVPYIPFSVGSLTHIMLAVFYKKKIYRESDPRFKEVMRILEDRWNRNIAFSVSPDYHKRLDRQFMIICGIAYGMMEQRIVEKDLDEFEVLQTESMLTAPLLHNVRWDGTPDIVLRSKALKELTHFDHKSTSVINDSFMRNLAVGVELEGDKLLIEQLFKEKVKYGYYNILQKHRFQERKGETREAMAQRIVETYRGTKFHFRYKKDYDKLGQENYINQQHHWIRQLQESHMNNRFPMNDESCVGFYDCQMLDFCSKKEDHIFKNFYQIVKKEKANGKTTSSATKKLHRRN